MKYRVHKLPALYDDNSMELEKFLNGLQGEIISIVPEIRKMTLGHIYGIGRRVKYLLIVEKIA